MVRFLIWLPDWFFILMVRALVCANRLFHEAAKGEIERQKPQKGLSKKHLEILYTVYTNSRAVNSE